MRKSCKTYKLYLEITDLPDRGDKNRSKTGMSGIHELFGKYN